MINTATGRDFTLNIVWADMIKEFAPKIDDAARFGGLLLDSCLGGLAGNIKKLCNDETGKNAFNDFATTGVIIFNANKKASSYWSETFVNGDLVIGWKSICNVGDVGKNIPTQLTCTFEDHVMPYLQVKSIKDKEELFNEHLQSINQAAGKDIPIFFDWAALLPFLKDVTKIQPNQVGSTLYESVIGGLAGNLKNLCKDEMSREAFTEACTGKIIITVETDKKASGYRTEKFVNGDLVIAFKNICNCSDIGKSVVKLL